MHPGERQARHRADVQTIKETEAMVKDSMPIKSMATSSLYRDNWSRIFGRKRGVKCR